MSILFLIAPISIIILYYWRKHLSGASCNITKDLTNKIVLVTGGNVGIGLETIRHLANLNATIIMASFEKESAISAIEKIKQETSNQNIYFMYLNLGNLQSVQTFAKAFLGLYTRLDILVNNAGIMSVEETFSENGFGLTMAVNYFGHFYLTLLLSDLLKKTEQSRVVIVSSITHTYYDMNWSLEKPLHCMAAYAQSKLALLLFTKELNRRLQDKGVKVATLHPGIARTQIANKYMGSPFRRALLFIGRPFYLFFTKDNIKGAQTTLQCCLLDYEELEGGGYYVNCQKSRASKEACNEKNQQRLWKETVELLSKRGFNVPAL